MMRITTKLKTLLVTLAAIAVVVLLIGLPKDFWKSAGKISQKVIQQGGDFNFVIGEKKSINFEAKDRSRIAFSLINKDTGKDLGGEVECYETLRKGKWRDRSLITGPEGKSYLTYSNNSFQILVSTAGEVFLSPLGQNVFKRGTFCADFGPDVFVALSSGEKIKKVLELPELPISFEWIASENKKFILNATALAKGNFELKIGKLRNNVRNQAKKSTTWLRLINISISEPGTPTQGGSGGSTGSTGSDHKPTATPEVLPTGLPTVDPTPSPSPITEVICGDSICDQANGETAGSCESDCPEICGDGYCSHTETWAMGVCTLDCGGDGYCLSGDGVCDRSCGENGYSESACCSNADGVCEQGCGEYCAYDDPACPACNYCGDRSCTGSETCYDCPMDCGECSVCNQNGQCDEGNGENSDNCPNDCPVIIIIEPCGNGSCDTGQGEGCETCPQDCGSCSVCNGICDESDYSQCPSDCETNTFCGDQIVTPENGEVCDDGELNGSIGYCGIDCKSYSTNAVCGDGKIEAPENCEGDVFLEQRPAQDCNLNTCIAEYCGDGLVNGSEQCDDGNNENGDDCDSACGQWGICGNRQCDDGESVYTCPEDCLNSCGNGICEEQDQEDYNSCPADCMHGDPGCGDGFCDTEGKLMPFLPETVDGCPPNPENPDQPVECVQCPQDCDVIQLDF